MNSTCLIRHIANLAPNICVLGTTTRGVRRGDRALRGGTFLFTKGDGVRVDVTGSCSLIFARVRASLGVKFRTGRTAKG